MNPNPDPELPLAVRWSAARLARNIVIGGLAAGFLLVLLDAVVNVGKLADSGSIRRIFNITREDGLSNWVSSTALLLNAATLWAVWSLARRRGTRRAWGWIVLALFFTWLAIDDAAAIHERVGTAFDDVVGRDAAEGGVITGSYSWQVLFVPVFAIVAAFMLAFFHSEFRGDRLKLLTFVALACWVAAVGLDYVEGLAKDSADIPPYRFLADQLSCRATTIEHFSKSLEEFIELAGATLFLAAFVKKLARLAGTVTIRFE